MGQHSTDIHFLPIVMDRCNQPGLVAPNIEDGEFAHFIRRREHRTHVCQRGKIALFHVPVPMIKHRTGIGVIACKTVQTLPCDDVYNLSCCVCSANTSLSRRPSHYTVYKV